jgi:hypothetical protein
MKYYCKIVAVIVLLIIVSCQHTTTLTEKQKEAIISEVKQVFEYTLGGIENRDAERAFSAFTSSTKLLKEGYIIAIYINWLYINIISIQV